MRTGSNIAIKGTEYSVKDPLIRRRTPPAAEVQPHSFAAAGPPEKSAADEGASGAAGAARPSAGRQTAPAADAVRAACGAHAPEKRISR